jgi:aminoglycoside 6'-N-acetyltransferase
MALVPIELQGEAVVLRPLTAEDRVRTDAIRATPEVHRWWGPPQAPDPDEVQWAIVVDGEVAGLIQAYEEDDPDLRYAGIDVFLVDAHTGRGLGTDAVRTLARHLFELGHHRVIIDPAVANERAIASYRKVGFQPVGVMRQYQRDPLGGGWMDALLMDLLRDELR